MYFPTADIEVQPWLPPLVAFCISFFTSMGGVSGAFLLLPFQVSSLGFTTPSVSATNHLFNIIAIPGGVYRFIREGRMAWPLTWTVIIGTLPGVLAGTVIRSRFLLDPTFFKHFIGVVLLYIGGKLFHTVLNKREKTEALNPSPTDNINNCISRTWLNYQTLGFTFKGVTWQAPTQQVILLSLIVGLIGGVLFLFLAFLFIRWQEQLCWAPLSLHSPGSCFFRFLLCSSLKQLLHRIGGWGYFLVQVVSLVCIVEQKYRHMFLPVSSKPYLLPQFFLLLYVISSDSTVTD